MLANSIAGILLKIFLGLCFTIDIFSFVIYVLILFFIVNRLIKKDKFYSIGFYTLIIFNGTLDLIFIVEEFISFRIPQLGYLEHFYIDIFSKYLISGMCYTYSIAQIIFVSLSGITITFNRYIAVKYPTKYNNLWSGWRLILFCTWPLFIAVPMFVIFYKTEVAYALTHLGSITVYYKDLDLNNLIWFITIAVHSIALCINIILNVLLVYTVKKLDIVNKMSNNSKNREMKLEVTMAKFAIVYCTFFAIVVCAEICMTIASNIGATNVAENILTFYVLIETIMVFFTPYTLLCLSYDFRQKFFYFIGLSKYFSFGDKNKSSVTIIQTPTNVFKSKLTQSKSLKI